MPLPHSVIGLGRTQVLAARLREPVANGRPHISSLLTRSDQYGTREYDFACRDTSSGGLVGPSHVPQLWGPQNANIRVQGGTPVVVCGVVRYSNKNVARACSIESPAR